ncbi:MAG TPA: GNAT family N-acetyltransferase [Acidimicrobiales bacterium]
MDLPDPPLADPAAGIVLRAWSPTQADVAALVAAWIDPALVAANRVPDDVSPAAAARWIRGEPDRRAAGACLDLVVGPLDGGAAVLGEVGLRNIDRTRRRAEMSWWIAAGHRGRGLAVAGVRLLAGWALSDQAGLDQVWARIDASNPGSARVARAAGFTELGSASGSQVWARRRVPAAPAAPAGGGPP